MDEFEGEVASTKETVAYCADLARPYAKKLLAGATFLVLSVVVSDVLSPLVFASVLDRIATLPQHAALWARFGNLIVAYAVLLVIGQALQRMSGWLEWEGAIRTFAHAIHRSFERLLSLGYRWHIDHPSGEVASALSAFAWALVDGIDALQWDVLRIIVVVLSAIGVLAVVAWPVALVLVALSAVFATVITKRSGAVTEASKRFARAHSRAEGTASDVIRNITAVLAGAGQREESARVADLLEASVLADLQGRRVFTVTRIWMAGTVSLMTWAALLVGVVLAVKGNIRAGVVYLVLFYASQVSVQLVQSFMAVRNLSRGLGRAAKLVALATTTPKVVDLPNAQDLVVAEGAVRFDSVYFSYIPERPLLENFNLDVSPGEHIGVVGQSGGGKSTITRLCSGSWTWTAGA